MPSAHQSRLACHQTNLNRRFIIAQEREARINGEIHAKEVRLISGTGEQLGIVTVKEALAMAEEQDVDLVEISPTAKPPVCKLMDYGKYKYEQSKNATKPRKSRNRCRLRKSNSAPAPTKAITKSKCATLPASWPMATK